MVQALPPFKALSKQQSLKLCKTCSFEIVLHDVNLFEKGDEFVDLIFVVVDGSVCLQQQLTPSLSVPPVVFGNNTPRGTLLVIETGNFVVHDYVILQQKQSRQPEKHVPLQHKTSSTKLSLDAPVASLGPSTIFFADEQIITPHLPSINSTVSCDTQRISTVCEYTIADSPEVHALSIRLYSTDYDSAMAGTASLRRNQDMLVIALLGHNGLQTVRAAIAAQRNRRAGSSACSIRLAAHTAPSNKHDLLLPPRASPLKRVIRKSTRPLPKAMQADANGPVALLNSRFFKTEQEQWILSNSIDWPRHAAHKNSSIACKVSAILSWLVCFNCCICTPFPIRSSQMLDSKRPAKNSAALQVGSALKSSIQINQ
ncbi:unnamed protein product [Phytophthora lilii]|uniref:Unnamed protein product n=1 Tax=Phytophthora lilii TaxID=2077276 RepID=A0A9W6WMQ2_9STRA|nr:unnamed protein product [Phytophthora lilii]